MLITKRDRLRMKQGKSWTAPVLNAFTIAELLIVVVILAVLTSITLIAYDGVHAKVTESAIIADLNNNSKILKLYFAKYGSYPTTLVASNCPLYPVASDKYCLKSNNNNTMTYNSVVPSDFHLTIKNNDLAYSINSNSAPSVATTEAGSAAGKACMTGFIPVPGSGIYGTNDFCVSKYEIKIKGNDNGNQVYSSSMVPDSRASGTPWGQISQSQALAESTTYPGCSSCHLISEDEWMTIAQNVLSVDNNWDYGGFIHQVGIGFIYQGHVLSNPSSGIAASTNDNDGQFGMTGIGTIGSNNRRTLLLTNGQYIWDFSGNMWEWTQGKTTSQPGLITDNSGYSPKNWNDPNLLLNDFPFSSTPISTGVGNVTWQNSSGVGSLYSNYNETGERYFLRGGTWTLGSTAGVLVLYLGIGNTYGDVNFGFRIAYQ